MPEGPSPGASAEPIGGRTSRPGRPKRGNHGEEGARMAVEDLDDVRIRQGSELRGGGTVDVPGSAAEGLSQIRPAMAAVRDDLGFETATLFAPGAAGWELLDR